jgi:hypothetical protein
VSWIDEMKPSKLLARASCSSAIEPELSTTNRKSIFWQPLTSPVSGSGSMPPLFSPTSNLMASVTPLPLGLVAEPSAVSPEVDAVAP